MIQEDGAYQHLALVTMHQSWQILEFMVLTHVQIMHRLLEFM